MNGFERLGRDLELASERGRGPSWSRRAGSAGGAAAIAAALATVAVVVVGAVALLHGHAGRSGSTAPAVAGAQPAPAAQGAAWARLLTCARSGQSTTFEQIRFAATDAAPDARLVAALGVLRRPWTAADAAPATRPATCQGNPTFAATATIDVRYVRYVGPSPHGGRVFLVPGRLVLPSLSGVKGRGAAPPSFSAARQSLSEACLITIGTSPVTQACFPLGLIDRPPAGRLGVSPPLPLPLGVARRVCSHLGSGAAARAKCLANIRQAQIVAPRRFMLSGVVRDGITSVDVYVPASHGQQQLLATVPVHNNVYAFEPARALVGPLNLVFRAAGGRAVPTMPVHTATGAAKSTVVP